MVEGGNKREKNEVKCREIGPQSGEKSTRRERNKEAKRAGCLAYPDGVNILTGFSHESDQGLSRENRMQASSFETCRWHRALAAMILTTMQSSQHIKSMAMHYLVEGCSDPHRRGLQ